MLFFSEPIKIKFQILFVLKVWNATCTKCTATRELTEDATSTSRASAKGDYYCEDLSVVCSLFPWVTRMDVFFSFWAVVIGVPVICGGV